MLINMASLFKYDGKINLAQMSQTSDFLNLWIEKSESKSEMGFQCISVFLVKLNLLSLFQIICKMEFCTVVIKS